MAGLMSDGFHNYVRDVLSELLERAREAKIEARSSAAPADGAERAFTQGRAVAYYEVVSHLVNQLDAFGLDRASIGVDPAYDADRDLL
jgi:hypothetical protein